jgi:hypothetical protein
MFRAVLAALVVLAAAASSAFASTTNLSGTVTTSVPANFSDDSASNAGNVTGASNGTYMTVQNTSSGASGTWTVRASLGATGLNNYLSLAFYVQTSNSSNVTADLTRIKFTDSSNVTTTLNISAGTFSMSPTSAAPTTFTFTSTLSSFTAQSGFNPANVNRIEFDITLSTQGNNKVYSLDAVDISSSAVPEPATVGLFAIGAVGLGFAARRKSRARAGRRTSEPRSV